MSKEEKKNRKIGLLISSVFHVLVILLLFAFTMQTEQEKEEPLIILDFSAGSSSKGGSSSEPTETEKVSEEPEVKTDPVTTQNTKSPVKKSTKPKSTSSSTSNSKPTKKANSKASAKGAFSGDGSGKSNGDGNGDNEGIGNGENGPGPTGKIGKLGAGIGTPPKVKNPTKDQEGKVVIELTVDRLGKVVDVKVLSNHPQTTTTDPVLHNQAKKDGYRFDFKADSRRSELSKGLRIINYILQ